MELNQYIKEQIINCHKVVDSQGRSNVLGGAGLILQGPYMDNCEGHSESGVGCATNRANAVIMN